MMHGAVQVDCKGVAVDSNSCNIIASTIAEVDEFIRMAIIGMTI